MGLPLHGIERKRQGGTMVVVPKLSYRSGHRSCMTRTPSQVHCSEAVKAPARAAVLRPGVRAALQQTQGLEPA